MTWCSAGMMCSATNWLILSSNGRTASGGSKSISVLRLHGGRQVRDRVEGHERNHVGVPRELARAQLELADRSVLDHAARADHVVCGRAEHESDRAADRTGTRDDADPTSAPALGDDAIERTLDPLREFVNALAALDPPLVAAPLREDRLERAVGELARRHRDQQRELRELIDEHQQE